MLTRAPQADDDPAAAIVIDDAHLLDDDELDQLAERVADSCSTIVVSAEPLAQRQALRGLRGCDLSGEMSVRPVEYAAHPRGAQCDRSHGGAL